MRLSPEYFPDDGASAALMLLQNCCYCHFILYTHVDEDAKPLARLYNSTKSTWTQEIEKDRD